MAWSSAFSDDQWIMAELDTVYSIGRVVLKWQSAYGKQYRIETATDTTSWQTVYTETKGNGGVDTIVFAPVNAKYVRLYGVQRASRNGYSLYEFEIYRPSATDVETPNARPSKFKLMQNYPNPFNPRTDISFSVGTYTYTSLRIYDLLGREVAVLVDEIKAPGEYSVQWNALAVSSGVYFYKLQAGGFCDMKKLVLLK